MFFNQKCCILKLKKNEWYSSKSKRIYVDRLGLFEQKSCYAPKCLNKSLAIHPKFLKKSLALQPKVLNKSLALHPKCLN